MLDISPFELLPDDIVQVDATTRGRSVPALRKQLLSYRFVNPRYLEDQAEALSVTDLTRAVANVWEAYQASTSDSSSPSFTGCCRERWRRRGTGRIGTPSSRWLTCIRWPPAFSRR